MVGNRGTIRVELRWLTDSCEEGEWVTFNELSLNSLGVYPVFNWIKGIYSVAHGLGEEVP